MKANPDKYKLDKTSVTIQINLFLEATATLIFSNITSKQIMVVDSNCISKEKFLWVIMNNSVKKLT